MNKKIMTIFALMFFSMMFVGGRAFAQTGWNTTEASRLIGYQVWSPITGEYGLGQISDLVIDQSNGRIALVILSDVPGFGAERVAVPYGSVVRTSASNFQLRIPPEKIGFGTPGNEYTNKYVKAMAPGVVPAVIDPGWVANLYRQYEQFPYWTEKGEHSLGVFYESSTSMGAKVDLAQGGTAKVDDLVIDPSNGQITFEVLSNVPGRTGDMFAVPFSMLTRKGETTFALNITKDKLASAPIFSPYEDLGSRGYAESVYRYFGLRPYWSQKAPNPYSWGGEDQDF